MAEGQKSRKTTVSPENAEGPKRAYVRPESVLGFREERHSSDILLTEDEVKLINAQIAQALHKVGIDIESPGREKGDKDTKSHGYLKVNEKGLYIDIPGHFSLARTYYPHLNNTMRHSYFEIMDEKSQGRGASKEIHRALAPIYERLGVKKITVHASLQNGGYTWGKYGFRTTRRDVEYYVDSEIKRKYRPQARAIVDKYFKEHPTSNRFPMHLLARQPWGKEAMTGTSWSGNIDLTNPQEKSDFYNYIGYKKK